MNKTHAYSKTNFDQKKSLIILYVISIMGFAWKNTLIILTFYQQSLYYGVILGERNNMENKNALFIEMEEICVSMSNFQDQSLQVLKR
jgi:hypothetical protein